MNLFHRHKFGPVDATGIQYCATCGEARRLPCAHEFEITYRIDQTCAEGTVGYVFVQKCKKCGELRKYQAA